MWHIQLAAPVETYFANAIASLPYHASVAASVTLDPSIPNIPTQLTLLGVLHQQFFIELTVVLTRGQEVQELLQNHLMRQKLFGVSLQNTKQNFI